MLSDCRISAAAAQTEFKETYTREMTIEATLSKNSGTANSGTEATERTLATGSGSEALAGAGAFERAVLCPLKTPARQIRPKV